MREVGLLSSREVFCFFLIDNQIFMKKILVIYALLGIMGCSSKLRPLDYYLAYKNMKWLEGSWEGTADGKPFCETWAFANDTLMINKNLDCSTNTVKEDGALIQVIDRQIYYTNQPKSGEKLLTWTLVDCDTAHIRFENPNAPYSQTMIFDHIENDKWRATLITKGKPIVYVLNRK
jgi:hypothetical protein